MQPFTLLILLGVASLVSVATLAMIGLIRRRPAWPGTGADLLLAMLGAIVMAGALGVGWFLAELLRYDGFMAVEFGIGGAILAFLAATGLGALLLHQRGARGWAVLVLLVGALPTAGAFALLLLIQAQGIDMR